MDTQTLRRASWPTPTGDDPHALNGPPSAPAGPRATFQRLWRGPQQDPAWARPALLALLLLTAGLYLVNLTSNGWANAYYSAAAQAGSASWKALLFGSSDAASSITVDKPPASLWVMALSVRLLGLGSFAILVPQVVMGVATVGVVHASVRRHFGAVGALLAGVVVATTPVAALMFRFNNPDALLVLLMALAAYATVRALEHASTRWALAVGALVGLGFLTKALQVFLVVPGFALAHLLAAPTTLRRRVLQLLGSAAAMVLAAGWWVAVVELVPAGLRPYIGGSQTNSFLELTFGYNGLGRLSGDETGSVGGGNGWGRTGLTRMFGDAVGAQVSWLIPSALVLLAVGLWLRRRAPRTDPRRAAYVLWGGWLVVTVLVFSFMAGIFHEYYTVALAPPVGALVGMGAAEAWERRHTPVGSVTLAVATAAANTWSFILLSRVDWQSWLRVVVLALGMAAALLLLALAQLNRRWVPVVVVGALVAALAGPAAYTAATIASPHTGSIVTAGPTGAAAGGPGGRFAAAPGAQRFPGAGQGFQGAGQAFPGAGQGGRGGIAALLDTTTPDTEVVSALSADASRFTWVAAAVGSQTAAGLQLGTGLAVMAVGGFNGSDPSPTLAQFQQDVAQGRIHYFAASGGRGFGPGSSGTAQQITSWVEQTYPAVTIGGSTFYDLTQPLSGTGAASSAPTT